MGTRSRLLLDPFGTDDVLNNMVHIADRRAFQSAIRRHGLHRVTAPSSYVVPADRLAVLSDRRARTLGNLGAVHFGNVGNQLLWIENHKTGIGRLALLTINVSLDLEVVRVAD